MGMTKYRYLEPGEPGSFTDLPLLPVSDILRTMGATHLCPLCKGHGGWVLTPNAYKLPPDTLNTPSNRARYCHFRAHCSQCNGWGYVDTESALCLHSYSEISTARCRELDIPHYGSCYHVYECTKCGRTMAQDSSG